MTKIAVVHVAYLALAGLAFAVWLRWGGETSLVSSAICFLPLLVGIGLAFTSQEDTEQYMMRLMVAAMFLPILLGFWAFSQDKPAGPGRIWPYGVGAAVLHAACFAGAILWLGTTTTRVPAVEGVTPVTAETLQARLFSLNEIHGPLDVSRPGTEGMEVVYRFKTTERSHRVLLTFDSETRAVRVKERLSTRDAKPVTDAERSLRGPGDPYFDPTRPEAQKVMSLVAQASTIKKEWLAAMPLTLAGRTATVPAEKAARLDQDGMITLLCKVVTQSGWNWEPGFFGQ